MRTNSSSWSSRYRSQETATACRAVWPELHDVRRVDCWAILRPSGELALMARTYLEQGSRLSSLRTVGAMPTCRVPVRVLVGELFADSVYWSTAPSLLESPSTSSTSYRTRALVSATRPLTSTSELMRLWSRVCGGAVVSGGVAAVSPAAEHTHKHKHSTLASAIELLLILLNGTHTERERERERESVCVCVYVCERKG